MTVRLVSIGDSLTQGFQHGAIRRAEWSYPAMVARALDATYHVPNFSNGPGGPVADIEELSHRLERALGENINVLELPVAAGVAAKYLDELEDYWERGDGSRPLQGAVDHHGLAVWGFEVLDALTLSDGVCLRNMPQAKDHFWTGNQAIEFAMYRTARRVLNPTGAAALEELTQVDAARRLAADQGGIENLVVALGANNALGTCTQLELRWSQSADFRKLAHQRTCTVWEPEHFARIYDRLVTAVEQVKARQVFLVNVPHVTIAPISRGVSPRRREPDAQGYYEFYTRFWIWDEDFDPDRHPCLRREDAKAVDGAIDEYNAHIKAIAEKKGWHLVDLCGLLDSLAFRRNRGAPPFQFPSGLIQALRTNPRTAKRVRPDGRVLLDSRFFSLPERDPDLQASSAEWQRGYHGGLFGLDGVHPTTIGYGLVAHRLLEVMRVAGNPLADPSRLAWNDIVANDKLVTTPPLVLRNLRRWAGVLFSRPTMKRLVAHLSGYASQPDSEERFAEEPG